MSGYVAREAARETNRVFQSAHLSQALSGGFQENPSLSELSYQAVHGVSAVAIFRRSHMPRSSSRRKRISRWAAPILSSGCRQRWSVPLKNWILERAAMLRDRIAAVTKAGGDAEDYGRSPGRGRRDRNGRTRRNAVRFYFALSGTAAVRQRDFLFPGKCVTGGSHGLLSDTVL